MIKYKNEKGVEVITTGSGPAKPASKKRDASVITTADLERGKDGRFHRKGQVPDEKSK